MKIAAVVIIYHPAKDAISNIKSYYDGVDKIFVFDNTETRSAIHDDLLQLPKVTLFHDNANDGIAKRLNEGCRIAINEQFDWILTMDQDTHFPAGAMSCYLNCFASYMGREKVAMFGVQFNRKEQVAAADCYPAIADKLITSGSLVNLSLYKIVGEFDEQLFIDAVDYDYCFRAQMAGFSIIRFSNIYITHSVGHQVYRASIKTLYLFRKKKEVHSAVRCYYMYRNMLYLKEKYKDQDKHYFSQVRGYVLSRIKVSLLYGRDTKNIVRYLNLAKSDFKNKRMGKLKSS